MPTIKSLYYGRGWVVDPDDQHKLRVDKTSATFLPEALVQHILDADLPRLSTYYVVGKDEPDDRPRHVNVLGVDFDGGKSRTTILNLDQRRWLGDLRPEILTLAQLCDAIEDWSAPRVVPLYDLSLSYAHVDASLARSVVAEVKRLGSSVVWDHGGSDDQRFASTVTGIAQHLIRPIIEGARCLAVVATEGYLTSDWTGLELKWAFQLMKPVYVWAPRDDRIAALAAMGPTHVSRDVRSMFELLSDRRITAHTDLATSEAQAVAGDLHVFGRAAEFLSGKGVVPDTISVREVLERAESEHELTWPAGIGPTVVGWRIRGPRYS